jgi:hypothetical protein
VAGVLSLLEAAARHIERLWPELAGSFAAYWVRVTHHRLFQFVLRLLPHARGASTSEFSVH